MADHRVWMTSEFKTKHQWAEVTCKACGWRVIYPGDSVNWLFRPGVVIGDAERRLRCRRCGKRGALVRALRAREYHG
jgi:DNA-directed RNA polymerase subunit RPC12/RpoP